MTEIDNSSARKPSPAEATAPNLLHDTHNAASSSVSTDKVAATTARKDSSEPSSKLYGSISDNELMAASKLPWDSDKSNGTAATEIMALNPLGDLSDRTKERAAAFDATATGKESYSLVGSIGCMEGQWKDLFENSNSRNVRDFDQMGGHQSSGLFRPTQSALSFNIGEGSAGSLGKMAGAGVDIGDALMAGYYSQTVRPSEPEHSSGFLGNLWDKAKAIGSEVIDEAKKLSTATIGWGDWSGTSSKVEEHSTAAGGKVETRIGDHRTTVKTSEETITQSRADADGKHDTTIKTNDGRTLNQDTKGERTASSTNSDITIKEDPQTGKVEAYDKSGNQVAEFNNRGDATNFFDKSIVQVVQPPKSLEDAYKDFQKEHPDQLKDHPILLMDGKGESLTERPDGSTLKTHANGNAEATYKHVGHDGKEHDIQINVTTGADGKDHITIGHVGEQQYELNTEQAAKIMAHSRMKMSDDGRLMVNEDPSGNPERCKWHHFVNKHHEVSTFDGGKIDLHTGQATIDDTKRHSVFTPNKDTGVTKMTETTRHPDGSLDANPSRVTTMDHGKITTQGEDPITGQLKANDVVTYDSKSRDLVAWNMDLTPDMSRIMNPDGSFTDLNQLGDFNAFDKDGNSLVDSFDDKLSYDGGNTYQEEYESRQSDLRDDYQDTVSDAILDVSQAAQAIDAHLSADMNPGELSALAASLDAAVAECMRLGIPIPSQVSAAQSELAGLQAKAEERKLRESNGDHKTA